MKTEFSAQSCQTISAGGWGLDMRLVQSVHTIGLLRSHDLA